MMVDEQYALIMRRRILILWSLITSDVKHTCHLRIFLSKDNHSWVSDIISQQNFGVAFSWLKGCPLTGNG